MVLAEVISIGDELTSGQRLDTNSQWLSERLGELGVRVMYHTTVADDLQANVDVFRTAVERADIVVSTGGLGPTADDLTREAIAQVAGVPLALDQASMEYIQSLFARRNRVMPERNRVQAMFPAGSSVIPNAGGTAPGIDVTIQRRAGGTSRVFALPGVPAEMFEMWRATVAPAVRTMSGSGIILHRRLKCFGVGESELEQMLPDLIRRGRVPQVGITASGATITLRITAQGATTEECAALIEPTVETVRNCIGSVVFGEEGDELQDAVVRLLHAKERTLGTIEWGTAGQISSWLGETQTRWYVGGMVITSRSVLERLLNFADPREAETGTSPEVVARMAEACRAQLGSDYALAVGTFPAYEPNAQVPSEFNYAVAGPRGTAVKSSPFASHPSILKVLSAKRALNLLRHELLQDDSA